MRSSQECQRVLSAIITTKPSSITVGRMAV